MAQRRARPGFERHDLGDDERLSFEHMGGDRLVTYTGDAFGRALMDWTRGETDPEIVERDDGFIELGAGPDAYLADFDEWPPAEKESSQYLRGPVLDVGCGGGRVALALQQIGHDVVGIDNSRLAVQATRDRGVKARRSSVEQVGSYVSAFGSIILFGNNFGVFGTPARAKRLLTEWADAARPGTRLFLESTDPFSGGAPVIDRRYVLENKRLGKPAGQCRMRIWYGGSSSSWISWFFASRADMRAIARDTGWRFVTFLASERRDPYVGVFDIPQQD
jgi:SAM-dependent methyltransferase